MNKFKVGDYVKIKPECDDKPGFYKNLIYKIVFMKPNAGRTVVYNPNFNGHNAQLDPLLGYGNHCHFIDETEWESADDYLLDVKLKEL